MKIDELTPVASAVIVRGAKTNRVKVGRRTYTVRQPEGREVYYRCEMNVRGKGHVVVAISLPPDEIAALDTAAERLKMARSHLIRVAVREYLGRNQEALWRAAFQR